MDTNYVKYATKFCLTICSVEIPLSRGELNVVHLERPCSNAKKRSPNSVASPTPWCPVRLSRGLKIYKETSVTVILGLLLRQWQMSRWKFQFSFKYWSQASWAQPGFSWIIPSEEWWMLLWSNQGVKLTGLLNETWNSALEPILQTKQERQFARWWWILTCFHV